MAFTQSKNILYWTEGIQILKKYFVDLIILKYFHSDQYGVFIAHITYPIHSKHLDNEYIMRSLKNFIIETTHVEENHLPTSMLILMHHWSLDKLKTYVPFILSMLTLNCYPQKVVYTWVEVIDTHVYCILQNHKYVKEI